MEKKCKICTHGKMYELAMLAESRHNITADAVEEFLWHAKLNGVCLTHEEHLRLNMDFLRLRCDECYSEKDAQCLNQVGFFDCKHGGGVYCSPGERSEECPDWSCNQFRYDAERV